MIPHRIQLAGFLSYKGEQEVRFSDAPLWMLAGTNGSGKSSVFDGVTYALFGSHRGGHQAAAELINKDSPALCVEFDFRHDAELLRARRTLKRTRTGTSGTQQLLRHVAGDWEPVPGTHLKAGFDGWVKEHVGLTYETFTSSVLLLQGRAEKLLDASPKGRAEVLAGIVDLERYQKLHDAANARKLRHKGELDALGHQTAAVPEVGDLEFAAAEARIEACDAAREQATAAVDAALAREGAAGRWADLRTRADAAAGKLQKAQGLLGEAARLEKQFARLRELREVLPAAFTVVSKRAELAQSEVMAGKLQAQRREQDELRTQAEAAQQQARQKRDSLRRQVDADESKREKASGRLRELEGLLEVVRQAEQQEAEAARLDADLLKLPADPEGGVRAAHEAADRLTALDKALPTLELFQTERSLLRDAVRTEGRAAADRDGTKQAGAEAKARHDAAVPAREAARLALTAAEKALTVADTLAGQARQAVADFADQRGAAACRACGQPLTPGHLKAEQAKRAKDERDAEAKLAAARTAWERAAAELAAAEKREADAGRDLQRLRELFRDHQAAAKQAQADITRLTASLALRHAELPDDHRDKVAVARDDWAATTYPERDELVDLRRQVGGLGAAKRAVQQAAQVATQVAGLRAKRDGTREVLRGLQARLTGDVVAVRTEHADLRKQEAGLVNSIKANKRAADDADREQDKWSLQAHTAGQRAGDLTGRLNTELATRKLHAEAAERALAQLPEAWKGSVGNAALVDYHRWKGELGELDAAGVEAGYAGLEQARGQLAGLRADAADARAAADAVPEADRLGVEQARACTAAARQGLAAADKDVREAQRHKSTLDGHRAQRAALGEQVKAADAAFTRYKTLAELLGRDRLQRHLVRTAERQIVDYANAVLDRLSGGQLFLRLVAGDDGAGADRALELECVNRVAGGTPILVAFLSGSQRFRVAVALALGIGQYASKQHRPIESVIIDEGFGCLDRAGRQVMIQELQNLRGHLHCILLVSHQEEFADAFPDGYRFALRDGATEVTRFER